jgi:glucose/arabinose dehydrogenase/putative cell wall-binding protein
MRRLVTVALVASLLALTPTPTAHAAHTRVAGADRYATSAAASASAVAADRPVVYVASGLDFPDALAAAPVAGSRRTSVLLVSRDAITDAVRAELDRLNPVQIFVLGGTASISETVEQDLRQYASGEVKRIAGNDRYATAANVSASYFSPGVAYTYVATGESFADALSAGAAGVDRGPVLLVTRNAIPQSTAAELQRLDPQEIIVVGGSDAIDASVESGLAQFTAGPVSRQAGSDRYATSAIVSSGAFQAPTDAVYLASGTTFPDALSGAPIAGANDGPVLLTQRDCVPDTVQADIDRLAPSRIVVFGGTAGVSDAAAERARCDATSPALGTTPTVIATGLDTPWDVAFEPDGTAFITERGGRILQKEPNAAPTVLQTITDVNEDGEGGLLGLERDSDGFLYAYYTTEQDNRVARFRPGEAPTPILTGINRASNHDAGRITIGPDGLLYIGVGDAAVAADAQDPASLNGKILRINRDGSIPAGNLSPTSPVYALGLRDPQGLAFDASGRLYSSEFGPDRDDEINIIVAGGNYGWPNDTGDNSDPAYVDPIVVRQPIAASWSGIDVVRGGIPAWDGDLLVAALRGQRLYRFDLAADGTVIGNGEELYAFTYGRLRHVEQAPDGSLWLLTSNRDGRGNPTAEDDRIIRIA